MSTPVNTVSIPTVAVQAPQQQAPIALPPMPQPGQEEQPQPQAQAQNAVAARAGAQQLQSQLDDSLKNSGIKAEIENEKAGLVIVRFVQADTGRVILQMPPQGVLDLVAQMEDKQPENSPLSGNMVDTSA